MKKVKQFMTSSLGSLIIAIIAGILAEWIRANWRVWLIKLRKSFTKKDDV